LKKKFEDKSIWTDVSASALDFMQKLLKVKIDERMSAK
jgi:hypothetical protein